MNKIKKLFEDKKENILNIYFTAGYPNFEDTNRIILELQTAGVDMIEVGIPYSDPLADGQTIQDSSKQALKNGITLDKVFQQLQSIKERVHIPIIIMGYYNQFLQYGIDKFIKKLTYSGVDGVIIPDLPMTYYEKNYQEIFRQNNIVMNFLITPETSALRVRKADQLSDGFIYVVSRSSITGSASDITESQTDYFERISNMHLTTHKLIGFGIHDKVSFQHACQFAEGAIIGSAFIRHLESEKPIKSFVDSIIR